MTNPLLGPSWAETLSLLTVSTAGEHRTFPTTNLATGAFSLRSKSPHKAKKKPDPIHGIVCVSAGMVLWLEKVSSWPSGNLTTAFFGEKSACTSGANQ
jgi:hypothetical protein